MPAPDRVENLRSGPDGRAWVALAWAFVCGVLYVHMVLRERAPGLLRRLTEVCGLSG